MAKAGFVLHGARGKVGNLVARKGENKTVLAEYQPVVRNPQTNAQMATRIILSTVSQAVPLLYPIIDHSFEGFAVGSKCTREFRRLNMNLLRQYAAIDFRDNPKAVDASVFMTTKGVKALIPNSYQISSGSLSPLKAQIKRAASPSAALNLNFNTLKLWYEGEPTITIGDVMQQLFGISAPGEQITIAVIQRSGAGFKYAFGGDDTVPGWVIPYTSFRAGRLCLRVDYDPNNLVPPSETVADYIRNCFNEVCNAFRYNPKSDMSLVKWLEDFFNANNYTATWDQDHEITVTFQNLPEIDNWCCDLRSSDKIGHAYAAGIIRSKLLDNGNWAYSNSHMVLARLSDDETENYGLDWNSAIQAWFEKNDVTDNSLFLKEGSTSNELGESFT